MNEQSGLPAWCPPIPEGWEVMDENTYREQGWGLASEGDSDFACSLTTTLVPKWNRLMVYIQPKQESER